MKSRLQRTPSLGIAVLIAILATSALPSGARGSTLLPIPTSTTIDTDVVWTGEHVVEGDLVIGNASRGISVRFQDCAIRVNGTIQVDSLALGFKPVTLRMERCTLTLGLTSSRILLDHSDPARSGENAGSTIWVSNSTIESPFLSPTQFPGGFVLRSGKTNLNRARVVIENTTFRNVGDYWIKELAAIHTRLETGAYSVFTPDSALRNLTFEYPSENMDGNAVAVVAGSSFPIAAHTFHRGFMGVGYGSRITGNDFDGVCRAIYDPSANALIEGNRIEGLFCKTIDFWTAGGIFRGNTVIDSIGPTFNAGADNWLIVDNDFIRSRIVGNTASGNEFRENRFGGITQEAGEAVIWDRGTRGRIVRNTITGVFTGAVYVQPHPSFNYTYDSPIIDGNEIHRFWNESDEYPAVKLERVANARVTGNQVSSGFRAFLFLQADGALLEDDVATDVDEGIAISGSREVVIRNSTFEASRTGLIMLGGNSGIRLIGVRFGNASFVDDLDSFSYSDYVDVTFPAAGPFGVEVYAADGTGVLAATVDDGVLEPFELHLFDRNRTETRLQGPFEFVVSGLVPGRPYLALEAGRVEDSFSADPSGIGVFRASIERRASFDIIENPDRASPAGILDLAAGAIGPGAWTLSWTAPGDDGPVGNASSYGVRVNPGTPVDSTTWDASTEFAQDWVPLPGGSVERRELTGVPANGGWWVGIAAYDEVGNRGPISNAVWVMGPDTLPPARIEDLSIRWNPTDSATLSWSAPGDDGMTGQALRYEIRVQNTGPIDGANWSGARLYSDSLPAHLPGSPESIVVSGLSPLLEHWLAIRAVDDASNWGPVSPSVRLPPLSSILVRLEAYAESLVVSADSSVRLGAWAFDSLSQAFPILPTWSAENGSVESNTFLPWSSGDWEVCAAYGALSSCLTIRVDPGAVAKIHVTPSSIDVEEGDRVPVIVNVTDIRGNAVTHALLRFTARPASLGSVVNGTFETRSPGVGLLRIEAIDSTRTIQVEIPIRVTSRPASQEHGSVSEFLLWAAMYVAGVAALAGIGVAMRRRRAAFRDSARLEGVVSPPRNGRLEEARGRTDEEAPHDRGRL